MNRYKLVAFDLDGTVLNSHHKLTEKTRNILKRLCDDGVLICISTGRSLLSALEYADQLQLPLELMPFICYNGSMVVNYNFTTKIRYVVASNPIPEANVRILLNFANFLGLVAQYYNGNTGEVLVVPKNRRHIELLKKYAILTGREQILVTDYEEALLQSVSEKITIMTDDADELIRKSNELLPAGQFNIIKGSPNPFFVEYVDINTSKGNGLTKLAESLGITLDR